MNLILKNIYFNIICLFLVIFAICYYSEKIVNKYSYEKGKSINKVVIPDIIQENVSNIKNLDDNKNCHDYLKKMYHLGIMQFGNMKYFHSDCLFWYKEYSVPSIKNIIEFSNFRSI